MKYVNMIKSFYPSFSKQEKKIADYILNERESISLMSLQEITKQISVSEATIVRFTKKLGFKGFVHFKIDIAKENIDDKENEDKNYIEKVSNNIKETIDSTKTMIDENNIEKALDMIENSDNMYIFGLGASGIAALEMQNRFMRYGKLGEWLNDSHFQTMYSAIATKKDIIIVLSLSGETAELIYPLKLAKKNGAKIIAITNYILSPVAKLADIVLLTSARETPLDGGSLISKISQLYIIDVLATGYAFRNKKKASMIKQKIGIAIANKNK